MRARHVTLTGLLALTAAGCQSTTGPIFPAVEPPMIWPPPPDRARIRYIGELTGEESLRVKPSGWAAVGAVLAGPRAQVGFTTPVAVAVAGERVFVADTGLGVVHRLDLAARTYRTLRGNEADPLQVPIDVAVLGGDTLAVVDRGRAAVELFDLDGDWRDTRRWADVTGPVSVAWDARRDTAWLVDAATHRCLRWRLGATPEAALGGRGGAPGAFNFPTAVAVDPLAGLVVADAMNFRVQVFGPGGELRAVFGQKGDAAGDFARPRDVAVDSEGHIYVLDNQFENVQIFSPEGQLLLAFGRGGSGRGEFSLPAGISIDEQDRIWVADSYNRRVQVFQYLAEVTACAN
jgi:DNA-binding beta-propeller fold protein YncE